MGCGCGCNNCGSQTMHDRNRDYWNRSHTRGKGGRPIQTGGIFDTIVGVGDWALGGIDEAAGEVVDDTLSGDFAGAADAAAGGFDEAAGSIVTDVTEGDIAGIGDTLAGGFDEAFGEFTTGLFNFDVGQMGDALAGSADEAFADEVLNRGPGLDPDDRTTEMDNPHEGTRDFDRSGTPTTDGSDSESGENGQEEQSQMAGIPTNALLAGGAAIGGLILMSKSGGNDNSERSVPNNTTRDRNIPGSGNRENSR